MTFSGYADSGFPALILFVSLVVWGLRRQRLRARALEEERRLKRGAGVVLSEPEVDEELTRRDQSST